MSSFSVTDISGAIMQQQARPNERSGHCTCAAQDVRPHIYTSLFSYFAGFDYVGAQHELRKNGQEKFIQNLLTEILTEVCLSV